MASGRVVLQSPHRRLKQDREGIVYNLGLPLLWGGCYFRKGSYDNPTSSIFMQMQLRYDYDPLAPQNTQIAIIDIFRGLSIVNSKNEEYSSRDGHVRGVLCDISYTTTQATQATLFAVPNSWKFRNSFRKFHFYRKSMFDKAGVTDEELGRYGKTIRPTVFSNAITVDNMSVQIGDVKPYDPPGQLAAINDGAATGGDWNPTTLAAGESYVDGNAGSIAQEFYLHILGDHKYTSQVAGEIPVWQSVGMIKAYNQDRQEVQVQTADTTIASFDNPLAALSTQTATSGEITDIAEDLELEAPPYDLTDDGDSTKPVALASLRVQPFTSGDTNNTTVTLKNVFLPAGFAIFDMGKAGLTGTFDVSVKAVLECRDWE